MEKRLTPARITLIYMAFASLWIFASDKLLDYVINDPALLLRLSLLKGLAFVVVTSLLLFMLVRLLEHQHLSALFPPRQNKPSRNLSAFLAGLTLLAPLFGYGVYSLYAPHIRQTALNDLASIAALKSSQIEAWLKEREDDAGEWGERYVFIQQVSQWLAQGDAAARASVLERFGTSTRKHQYELALLKSDGSPVQVGDDKPDPETRQIWAKLFSSARAQQHPVHSELYRDSTGHFRMDYAIPLYLKQSHHLVGVLIMRAPAEHFLQPLLDAWPTASPSAETTLVRRDGNQVLHLGRLRNRDAAEQLKMISIDEVDRPSVKSVLRDDPFTMEGVDYRGATVLAASHPVTGTGWHLITKVDRSEVMTLIKQMLFWIILASVIAITSIAAAILMLWRQQQRLHQMELIASNAEKDKQLKLFYELPFIGMSITSPLTKRWLYANDRLCDMLGYPREELLKTTWQDLTHPDDLNANLGEFRRMVKGEISGFKTEKRFIRKDGMPITVNVDIKSARDQSGQITEVVALIEDITERKQAEQALQKSEATYRSLFENMFNGIAHCRMLFKEGKPVDYEFIEVNPGWERATGLTQQAVGKRVSEVIPGYCEQNPDSLAVFGKVAQTGEPTRWEHYLKVLDKWFAFSIYSPAPGEFVAVTDDITERKRAETELRESEDKFRRMFTDATDGILVAEVESRKFIMANPAMRDMLGYTDDELLKLTLAEIHPARDYERNLAIFERFARGDSALATDIPLKRKDGALLYVDIKASPLKIGGTACLMGIFRDITARKKAEEYMRQSATVFESSHDGIFITDTKGFILAVNKAFQHITGYSEEEVRGKNPRILQSGRQSRDFYHAMWRNIQELGYWHGEIWNRRKNGEIFPEWLTISAVKNGEGLVTHYVGTFSDLSQIKQSEERAEHIAHYDPLTDLPNRLLIQSHLSHMLTRALRYTHRIAVLYIDLDRFKNINESLGYQAGDEMLVKLTDRLNHIMRGEDMLARLGGDEFLLVLESVRVAEDAAVVARALLTALTEPFILNGRQEVFIGASIGISIYPNDGSTAAELIQHADAAMHKAKQLGSNSYLFYTEALTRTSEEKLALEMRLRQAINNNHLRVYYQPQVDIDSGLIIGAEALVRWQDPERGLISPVHFIPIAEETGVIEAVGEWVLREACRQGAQWIEEGLTFKTLAVNLSPHQFIRGNIVELVGRVLKETGFPADRLELEITESALMQREEEAVKMLHLLRALNIRLAIDDFGTGYSSLSYLKRFPLDVLKIDKSFVDDIPFHQDDMEIAATIIAMGHTLGFKVLAEGVETQDQLSFLRTKGCDFYQGYLTSPPVPGEAFAAILKQYHPEQRQG